MFEFPETSPVTAAIDSAHLCFSEQKTVVGPVLVIILAISSGSKVACLLFDSSWLNSLKLTCLLFDFQLVVTYSYAY